MRNLSKKIFKLVSCLLVSSMVFSSIAFASVKEQIITHDGVEVKVSIVKDNTSVREVVTEDDVTITTATLDKINNVLKVEEKNKATGKLKNSKIDMNSKLVTDGNHSLLSSNTFEQETAFTKLKYIYVADSMAWGIINTKGNYKVRYEKSTNSDDLLGFKDAVDTVVSCELGMTAGLNVAAGSIVVAGITAPTGVGACVAIIAALGGAIEGGYAYWGAVQAAKDADFHYARVK